MADKDFVELARRAAEAASELEELVRPVGRVAAKAGAAAGAAYSESCRTRWMGAHEAAFRAKGAIDEAIGNASKLLGLVAAAKAQAEMALEAAEMAVGEE